MKKTKDKIVLGTISITLISAFAILLACLLSFFYNTTSSPADICKELSFKKATQFEHKSVISNSGIKYLFYLSLDGSADKQQELFVFVEKPFGVIKSTSRYELLHQTTDTGVTKSPVCCLVLNLGDFYTSNSDDATKDSRRIYYSDNISNITTGEMVTQYNCNYDVTKHSEFTINENEPFIIISEPMKNGEKLISIKFFNSSEKLIYESFGIPD